MSSKRRIMIIASANVSLKSFRGDFIKALISEGYQVYGAAPEMTESTSEFLKSINAIPLEYKLQRSGLNPFKDLQTNPLRNHLVVADKTETF